MGSSARGAANQVAGAGQIIPGAEPFFIPGGASGCLLLHGFTGTPREMRWMGEYLAQRGHTVLAVRLAGHATQPQDLLRARWQDWLADVQGGWELLRGCCERVFLMGLSMGGDLGLLFAARQAGVAGVVAMSTPYSLPPDRRLPFISLFQYFQPRVPKGPPDWRNPQAAQDHIDYPFYPTRAIIELRDLLAETRAALPAVHVPVLLAHSRQDSGVEPSNMQRIYERLGSADKSMLWVEDSGHVIIREPQRERVFAAAAEFVQRLEAQPT